MGMYIYQIASGSNTAPAEKSNRPADSENGAFQSILTEKMQDSKTDSKVKNEKIENPLQETAREKTQNFTPETIKDKADTANHEISGENSNNTMPESVKKQSSADNRSEEKKPAISAKTDNKNDENIIGRITVKPKNINENSAIKFQKQNNEQAPAKKTAQEQAEKIRNIEALLVQLNSLLDQANRSREITPRQIAALTQKIQTELAALKSDGGMTVKTENKKTVSGDTAKTRLLELKNMLSEAKKELTLSIEIKNPQITRLENEKNQQTVKTGGNEIKPEIKINPSGQKEEKVQTKAWGMEEPVKPSSDKGADRVLAVSDRFDMKRLESYFKTSELTQGTKHSANDIVQRIAHDIKVSIDGSHKELTVKLKPEYLGKIKIHLEQIGNEFTGKMIVENSAVKELMDTKMQQLKDHLWQNGYAFGEFTVEYSGGNSGQEQKAFDFQGEASDFSGNEFTGEGAISTLDLRFEDKRLNLIA